MKRIIKFRAWDGEDNRYLPIIEGHEYTFRMDDDGLFTEYESTPQKNITLQMFTGLCDKNGKEIYEGDIVEWNTQRTVVEYDEYGTYTVLLQSSGGHDSMPEILGNYNKIITVIGNIYENNELLK